jgi:hypothetical protein
MIDFTKIQTFPVPPPIKVLQTENKSLFNENKAFKKGIIIGVGVLMFYIAYHIYIKNKKDEANKKNQSIRD